MNITNTLTNRTARAMIDEVTEWHNVQRGYLPLLTMALRTAITKKREDAAVLNDTAARLRAGQSVAWFADGEAGASSADWLAGAHLAEANEMEALLGTMTEADTVLIGLRDY